MPAEADWAAFFDAETAVARLLGEASRLRDIVEFGCGYGTFTLPAARRTTGVVTALDIDPEMIATVHRRAAEGGHFNIRFEKRDFVTHGTGLSARSQSHAMIYNLLHLEHPIELLKEARRVLADDGKLSVIHWRSDIATPRGPSLDIRPTPEQCRTWLEKAGFTAVDSVDLKDCCPFHFGLVASLVNAGNRRVTSAAVRRGKWSGGRNFAPASHDQAGPLIVFVSPRML